MLAEKLNMTNEEAEKWIVDLIRNARLDAKIDSKLVSFWSGHFLLKKFSWKNVFVLKGHVVFGAQVISPYQQIIEKTKNLTTKANAISLTIDKKMKNVDSVSQM